MRLFCAVLLLVFALAPARADYSGAEWAKLKRRARVLRRKSGARDEKLAALRDLGKEDSLRVAREYAAWMAASLGFEKKLVRDVARARARFRKGRVSESKRDAYDDAVRRRDAERSVREEIAVRIGRLTDGDALTWLGANEDRVVQQARASLRFRLSLVQVLLAHPSFHRFKVAILGFANDEELPHARIRVLDWIARHKVREGREAAQQCLGADAAAIRRAAVRALRGIDDPRAVAALVRALATAKGQLAHEIEDALRWYTGQPFTGFGSGAQYSRWWMQHGVAWLAAENGKRWLDKAKQKEFRAAFYGIHTRSTRIVFVLDRSGSMREPVPQRGPVSGSKRDNTVPGKTKMEVAKNQLARTIRTLHPDVKFTVVFFDSVVESWTKAPVLRPATPKDKHEAEQWFDPIGPSGATRLFTALHKALGYAKTMGRRKPGASGAADADADGADTIFLLSDGYPTYSDASMSQERIDKEVARFLKLNRIYRCVVHTIGVGPAHSEQLMRRLAEKTGGTYRAVGMPRRKAAKK